MGQIRFPVAVPDFFADANTRFVSEDLTLDPEAEGRLKAIYSRAQQRVEQRIRTEGPDSIQQALDNHKRFLDALVGEAQEHHGTVINKSMIDRVLSHLCPLFPIC
jgi:hypothetical protein